MDGSIRTDINGKQIVERRHWSYSAIEQFTQCARRFHAYQVLKAIKEPENDAMRYGFRVHKAMADFITGKSPLPNDMLTYGKWVRQAINDPANDKVLVEQKMACTFELEPCEYFDKKKKVWLRTVADLLVINGNRCISWDWKTGQEKDARYDLLPQHFQLKLVALTVFLHHPDVEYVESAYVYLSQGVKTEFRMEREELRDFIPQMYDIVGGLQRAIRTGKFPPRPSGLCKKHCAITGCEYHGRGAY